MTLTYSTICKGCRQQKHMPIPLRGVLSAPFRVVDEFYDRCANAIWRHDGLLNKTIGDAVMAIFNFPICHADHARQAVLAAREMQRDFAARRDEFGVGIGIHCGQVSFGEFGHSHRDVTAIGTVVNTAARTQAAAEAGQILVTEDVCRSVGADLAGVEPREYRLKGFGNPIKLYAA